MFEVDGEILKIENVVVNFNGFFALKKTNLSVNKGELRFLIGPNGAGKTTLLDVICGKIKTVSGKVFFKNQDITNKTPYKICRMGISRKFQTPSIFKNLTVFENMELAFPKAREFYSTFFYSFEKKETECIEEILSKVGLINKKNKIAGTLSHGEKQWLEIGMTVIQKPALLLVDEPVAGMTGKERDMTGILLKEIAKECSVIVVEHDMNFVEKFSEKVSVLHEGRVICEGSFSEIKEDPYVIEIYLGRGGKKNA